MLKVFIDTEFTDLRSPELISLGLAAETGEEAYFELPFEITRCSTFVREVVIPLLEGTASAVVPLDVLPCVIIDWFNVVRLGNEPVLICYEDDVDWKLFCGIFDGYPPSFAHGRNVVYEISDLLRVSYFLESGLAEHHALNDAKASLYAFRDKIKA